MCYFPLPKHAICDVHRTVSAVRAVRHLQWPVSSPRQKIPNHCASLPPTPKIPNHLSSHAQNLNDLSLSQAQQSRSGIASLVASLLQSSSRPRFLLGGVARPVGLLGAGPRPTPRLLRAPPPSRTRWPSKVQTPVLLLRAPTQPHPATGSNEASATRRGGSPPQLPLAACCPQASGQLIGGNGEWIWGMTGDLPIWEIWGNMRRWDCLTTVSRILGLGFAGCKPQGPHA